MEREIRSNPLRDVDEKSQRIVLTNEIRNGKEEVSLIINFESQTRIPQNHVFCLNPIG